MEKQDIIDAMKTQLETFKEGLSFASKEEFTALENKLNDLDNSAELKEIKDAMEAQGLALTKITNSASENKKETLVDVIEANKEEAENQGYFWAVKEAKVLEGSAVPIGSNTATPTLEVKNEPLKDTRQDKEPEQSTLTKDDIINVFKNLQ